MARALRIDDPQLVADVTDVLGHTPSYEDVMDVGHYWGTAPTDTLLQILDRAYPMPPRAGGSHRPYGAVRRAAHTTERKRIMILSRDGREFYEISDLALLWGERFARHVWDLVIVGAHTDLGLNRRTANVEQIPAGPTTTDYAALVPAETWPDVLSIAVRIADKEGVR